MVTINQLQSGFARFIDQQLSGAFTGWQKAVVIGGGALIAKNIPNLVNTYAKHPAVAAFGIYHPEDGTVDIDALYNAITPNLGGDKLPITIPWIGTVKLGQEDLEVLRRYIKEA